MSNSEKPLTSSSERNRSPAEWLQPVFNDSGELNEYHGAHVALKEVPLISDEGIMRLSAIPLQLMVAGQDIMRSSHLDFAGMIITSRDPSTPVTSWVIKMLNSKVFLAAHVTGNEASGYRAIDQIERMDYKDRIFAGGGSDVFRVVAVLATNMDNAVAELNNISPDNSMIKLIEAAMPSFESAASDARRRKFGRYFGRQ